jgi:hypothetical protein
MHGCQPALLQSENRWALAELGGDVWPTAGWAENNGWRCIAGWGRDGWDCWNGPYYMLYVRRDPADHRVATDCERDMTVWTFASREECVRHIDCLAFWHWCHHSESWVEGMPMFGTWEEIPAHLRGPYSSDRHEAPLNPIEEEHTR